MPSRMSGSGRESLPYVREWSQGPLECQVVVESPSRMSGSGRKALLDDREWSGNPPGCLGVGEKPYRCARWLKGLLG